MPEHSREAHDDTRKARKIRCERIGRLWSRSPCRYRQIVWVIYRKWWITRRLGRLDWIYWLAVWCGIQNDIDLRKWFGIIFFDTTNRHLRKLTFTRPIKGTKILSWLYTAKLTSPSNISSITHTHTIINIDKATWIFRWCYTTRLERETDSIRTYKNSKIYIIKTTWNQSASTSYGFDITRYCFYWIALFWPTPNPYSNRKRIDSSYWITRGIVSRYYSCILK